MTLAKAQLVPKDDGAKPIEFMFNPTELAFEKTVETHENKGSQDEKGNPKISFANTSADKITISKILFDTYETDEDVVAKYIAPFIQATQFPEGGGDKKRTPLYTFMWGSRVYLRSCFIKRLAYKLILFAPDGKPLRAVIDSLTLEQVEETKPDNDTSTPSPSQEQRKNDSPGSRQKA